ncbi:hypothetical protein LINPERPRIM_LOCUS27707 [Linum perenne]
MRNNIMKWMMIRNDETTSFRRLGWTPAFTASLVGGAVLGWWEYSYHPTNTQQWMVPFGLILFATPLFVCFAAIVSDFWNEQEPGDVGGGGSPAAGQLGVFDSSDGGVRKKYCMKGENIV